MSDILKVLVSHSHSRDKLFVYNSSGKAYENYKGSLQDNVLHVEDVFDDDTLLSIFQKFGKPKYVISCGCSQYLTNKIDVPIFVVDAWIASELSQWEQFSINKINDIVTTKTANFQINKKQINRYLTIKMCEILDIDVNYTWSGTGRTYDLQHIIDENQNLNCNKINKCFSEILAPIKKFKKKWIQCGRDESNANGGIANYGHNFKVWNAGLDKLMSSTAISLIAESIEIQKCAEFTEKTAFSVLAHTFPIWVGGYNMASKWREKGFDVFDDIIDHSYESMPTLLERCFFAFYLNKDILTDIQLATELRNKNIERLVNNNRLLTPTFIKNYNKSVIKTWPEELKIPASESISRIVEFK